MSAQTTVAAWGLRRRDDRGALLFFVAGILFSEACRVENPGFAPLQVRDDASSGATSSPNRTNSAPSPGISNPTSAPHGSSKGDVNSEASSASASSPGSPGDLTLPESADSKSTTSTVASGTSMSFSSTGSSGSMSSTSATTTGSVPKYCATEAAYCYLVDDKDSGNTIADVRGKKAPMTITKGRLGPTEPGVPNQAKVFTVSEDGINAQSSIKWTPPLAGGIAFDVYAKLPENPQFGSFIFGLHFRLILLLDDGGSVVCSFNQSENEVSFVTSAALAPIDTNWHHYACEYDGQYLRLWVDGQPGPKRRAQRPSAIPAIPPGELGGNGGVQTKDRSLGQFRGSLSAIRIWTDLAAFAKAMSP